MLNRSCFTMRVTGKSCYVKITSVCYKRCFLFSCCFLFFCLPLSLSPSDSLLWVVKSDGASCPSCSDGSVALRAPSVLEMEQWINGVLTGCRRRPCSWSSRGWSMNIAFITRAWCVCVRVWSCLKRYVSSSAWMQQTVWEQGKLLWRTESMSVWIGEKRLHYAHIHVLRVDSCVRCYLAHQLIHYHLLACHSLRR